MLTRLLFQLPLSAGNRQIVSVGNKEHSLHLVFDVISTHLVIEEGFVAWGSCHTHLAANNVLDAGGDVLE